MFKFTQRIKSLVKALPSARKHFALLSFFLLAAIGTNAQCIAVAIPQSDGLNSGALPTCWSTTVVTTASIGTPSITFPSSGSNPSCSPYEGSTMAKFNSYSNSGGQIRLESLPVSTSSVSSVDVSFYWLLDNTNYTSSSYATEGVQVQYSTNGTTWTNAGSFIPRADGSNSSATWIPERITLPSGAAGQSTLYVGFLFTSAYGDNCFMDSVRIEATPSCVMPTTVTASNITSSSATISWTAPSSGTTPIGYEYVVSTSSTSPTGSGTAVTSASTNVTSLSANTTYYVFVRTKCTSTQFSSWTLATTFTTLCVAATLPQFQGFNSSSIPGCWSTVVTNAGNYSTPAISYPTSLSNPTASPLEGSNLVKFNSYNCDGEIRLISLPVSSSGISSVDVSFYWLNDNTNYTGSSFSGEGVQIQYSTNGGSSWTNAGSFIPRSDGTTSTANWVPKRVTLPSGAGNQSNLLVGFLFTSAFGDNCGMDAVTIERTPTCFPPTGVTISNITSNSATASWTAPTTGTTPIGYQYSVSTSSTAPTGAGTAITSASTSFTGLSGSTTYYVFVRSKCSSTDSSAWTLATSFTTFCSSATLPFLESFGTSGLPSCWTSYEGSTGASKHWVATSADASHGAGTAASGSGFAYLYVYLASTSYNPYYLTSTPIFLPAKAKLKYYYFLGADGYSTSSDPNPLEVQISTNYGSSWTTLYSHTYANTTFATSSTSSWNQNTIALGSTYAGQNVLIRFKSNSNYGGGTCDQGLDEVSLDLSEPTATNSTQCGAGTPTCSVASTTSVTTPVFKWYTAATGGTALTGQTGSTLSSYSISATTTFYVSEIVSGIESPRTPVTATVYTIPTASVSSATPPTCYNGNNGSATGSGSGGTSPYTYSWNTSPGQSTQIASNLAAGTYIVTVTDAHSCHDTESVTLANPSISTLPAVTVNPQSQTVCAGSIVKMVAAGTGLGLSYQWYIYNGTAFVPLTNTGIYSGVGTDTLTITAPTAVNSGSQYRCVITGTCSPSATTSTATLTVNQVIPSVSVSVNPGTTICAGTSTTFTATPTNGGTSPVYAWKVNGSPVGTNSSTYSSSSLTNGSSVTCTITSNATCAYPASATSSPKFMTVNPNLTPAVSISVNPGSTICAGTSTTFTASPTNGGISPTYVWKKNGSSVGTGSSYSSSTLSNNDVVTCTLTSSVTCVTSSTATSTGITMTVHPILVPSVTITPDSPTVCSGNTITFTASTVNPGTSPVYTWKVNGTTMGSNSSLFANNTYNDGDIVTCTLTSNAVCVNPANVTSTGYPVTIISRPLPALLITASTDTNICSGTLVSFHTAATNGGSQPQYQWMLNGQNMNGATANVYSLSSLSSGDVISCILTSNAVCATPKIVSSNQMMFNVEPTTPPNIYISSNKGTVVKPGDTVTFSAVSINGGLTPSYMWKKNGAPTGVTASVYTTADISHNDKITAVIFSSNDCANPDSATSNTLTMNLTTDVRAVESSITNVALYPNPNSGTFTIQATLPVYASNASYEILNNLGQIVSRGFFETAGKELKKEIFLNEVASGNYFIRISAGENRAIKQFTVQR